MPRERNAFKLGLVLIVMAAVFVGAMIYIPSVLMSGRTVPIRVRFPHTYPLPPMEVGSFVLVGGQKAGAISGVSIEELGMRPEPGSSQPARRLLYVVVKADVRSDLAIHRDCRVTPEGPPLGGPGLLRLDVGSSRELLGDGTIIDGDPPSGFAAVVETFNRTIGLELNGSNPSGLIGMVKRQLDDTQTNSLMTKLLRSMNDFNAVTASVRGQLDAGQRDAVMAKLVAVMDNLNATTAELRHQMDSGRPDVMLAKINGALDTLGGGLTMVNSMIKENRGPVNETVRHVAHTAETLDLRVMQNVAEQTDIRNAAGLMTKIHEAADQLNLTLKNITTVSGTAREVAVLNRENVNEILRNFKQTSEHVKSAVKFVLRRPWLLFNAPTPSQTRQQDIFDAARTFAEAASHLDDATSELSALAELHNGHIPADDADLARIRAELKETFEKFQTAEASLWKQLEVK